MQAKALDLKNWSNQTISPLAWKRIVLRALPVLNERGIDLSDMEEPKSDLVISDATLNHILECIDDIYQVTIPGTLINS